MSSAVAANRNFYDEFWSASGVISPRRFNTWSLVSALTAATSDRLEVGPGLHPRLPIAGSHFVDVSRSALARLKSHGGLTTLGEIGALPFPDNSFDVVCAFDIVEHVEDDGGAFRELRRVAREGAAVIFSVPLHAARWSPFDTLVGHVRRYDPDDLRAILERHSFVIEQSAVFGMQPRNDWVLKFAAWALTERRDKAMRWYNNVILPIGLLLQKRLAYAPGLIDVADVDELLLVCRSSGPVAASSPAVQSVRHASDASHTAPLVQQSLESHDGGES